MPLAPSGGIPVFGSIVYSMKEFFVSAVYFLAAAVVGGLPANGGKWKISTVDYRGKKLPMRQWAFLAIWSDERSETGKRVDVVCSNGIWDAGKMSYTDIVGRPIRNV